VCKHDDDDSTCMRDDEDNDSSGVAAEGDRPSVRQVINVESEMVVFTPC